MFNLTYKGKSFNQREDGYVNLGELCATHDKNFKDWKRNQSSQEYLNSLAETLSVSDGRIILVENLIIPSKDSIGGNAGTWGHPLIAIEVARWLSSDFGVWCNLHIKTLMETGSSSIVEEKIPTWALTLLENQEIQKQNFELQLSQIKEQNQLLLADKSQNEELGIEVIENFPKIPELLDYLNLENLSDMDCFLHDDLYRVKTYYSFSDICDVFRKEYLKKDTKNSSVFSKSKHNIGKIYQQLTGKKLAKDVHYLFDKVNCLFALFVLDTTAKEIGKYKVSNEELEQTPEEKLDRQLELMFDVDVVSAK